MPIPNVQIKGGKVPESMAHHVLREEQVLAKEPPREKKKAGKRRRGVWVVFFFCVLALIPYAASGFFFLRSARVAQTAVHRATDAVQARDFLAASRALDATGEQLDRMQGLLIPWRLLHPLPWVGTQVTAVEHTVLAGKSTVAALKRALAAGQEIFALAGMAQDLSGVTNTLVDPKKNLGMLSVAERRAILEKVLGAEATFTDIEERLTIAEQEIAQVPENGVAARVRQVIAPFAEKVHQLTEGVHTIAPFMQIVPRLAGYPTPKTFLFFLANNTELRPSAGFFGFYGILKTADGEIVSLTSDDVYNLDFPARDKTTRPAPAPLTQYIGVQKWFLRDVNWSPDFAVVAQDAMRLYQEEIAVVGGAPEQLDGVIAVTPDLAEKLLAIVGPISVRGVTFTAENVVKELEYQVEYAYLESGTPVAERKDILSELLEELVHRLVALPAGRWAEVGRVVEQSLREKQLLLYAKDAELQQMLEAEAWAGRVSHTPGDSLLIVDANLGSLKTDAVMQRALSYEITSEQDGTMVATARVTYTNNGRFTPYTTRYRTYVRLYVPEGSTLLRAEGQLADDLLRNPKRTPGVVDVSTDLGHTVFGLFTAIEPGETRSVAVTYRLPQRIVADVAAGTYELVVQKQSGAAPLPLTLDLWFDKKVQRAAPPEATEEWGDARYHMTSTVVSDQLVTVGF
jgi:hypothetical protein